MQVPGLNFGEICGGVSPKSTAVAPTADRLLACCLLACCLLAVLAPSQSLFAQKGAFQVGARVFPQYTRMLNSSDAEAPADSFEALNTFGMAVGILGGYNIKDHYGVQLQLIYSAQGQNHLEKRLNNNLDTVDVRVETKAQYLKIPVLFRLNTNPDKKYVLHAELGPQLEFLLGASETDDDKRQIPRIPPNALDYPTRFETLSKFNVGAVLAVGVDVKLRYNLKMNLQVRADMNFLDVENKDAQYFQDDVLDPGPFSYYAEDRATTRNLTVGVGLGFTYLFLPKLDY